MNTEIERISTDLESKAQGLRVVDQESANRATQYVLVGKDAIKQIKAFFSPLKQAQDEAKRKLLEKEKSELAKLAWVDRLTSEIVSWRAEEDRKRRAAEDAAYRAEQLRIIAESEAKRKAEEALRAAERAEAKGDEERANKLIEKAAKIEEKAASAPPPSAPIIPSRPVTDGLSMRDNWCCEVEDASLVPRAYLMVNEILLRQVVKAHKGQVKIPGIRVYNQPIMSAIGHRNGASA